MVDLVTIGLVIAGLVLLFAGAALSVYGVALIGMVFGGGSGYLLAPTVGDAIGIGTPGSIVLAVLIGALAGAILAYSILSLAIGFVSLFAGTYLGLVVLVPDVIEGAWYVEWGAAVAVGIGLGLLSLILTRTVLVFVTSAFGAAIGSRSITFTEIRAAQEGTTIEPLLFDPTSIVFLGLFVLGVLTQFGLFRFGYVTRLATALPGATVLRNKTTGEDQPDA